MCIKHFQLSCVILLLHTSITLAQYLRKNSSSMQLCFDLSSSKHGQFGKQTVEVANENTQWLLGYDEVTKGRCKNMEQILNERETRQVSYCKHTGTARNGREYEMHLPRYLERYLNAKGAGRGECMNAVSNVMELSSSDYDIDTVALCFDLKEYGKQTINVAKTGSKWFLQDNEVTRGPCDRAGVVLDRRETEMDTFCKHFGSAKNGYQYEIVVSEIYEYSFIS